jgi:hypothetical protein
MRFCRGFLTLTFCMGSAAALCGQAQPNGSLLVASASLPATASLFGEAKDAALPDSPGPAVSAPNAISSSQSPAGGERGASAWQPLNVQQRLILFWNDTYNSPGAFLALSAGALAEQISGTPAAWSQDGDGYTRRFASNYGQLAARNVIHEGLAGVTGLDPRYIPCNCQGAFRRTSHALKMTFTTYSRSGRTTLDVPQIVGAYGSGMVSTYWYPHRLYSPTVQGIQFGHEEMGEVFVGNLVTEFSSDLKRAFHLGSSSRASRQLARPLAQPID